MADQVLTKQKLIDADEDVQALEDVVNGEPGQLIKTRLGREVYTLASVPQINTMTREEVAAAVEPKANKVDVDAAVEPKANKVDVDAALSTKAPQATTYTKAEVDTTFSAYVGGRKAYTTLALAQADQANLPANTAIEVTNDGAKNGTYQWNGTTLTKSAYDPLQQAKAYAQKKSSILAIGVDLNTLTDDGIYHIPTSPISASLLNKPDGLTRGGVLIVKNSLGNVAHQTVITKNGSFVRFGELKSTWVFNNWSGLFFYDEVIDVKKIAEEISEDAIRREADAFLVAGLDLNELRSAGIYHIPTSPVMQSLVHRPEKAMNGGLIIVRKSDVNRTTHQVLINPQGVFVRFEMATGWQGWVNIPTENVIDSKIQTAIGGIDSHSRIKDITSFGSSTLWYLSNELQAMCDKYDRNFHAAAVSGDTLASIMLAQGTNIATVTFPDGVIPANGVTVSVNIAFTDGEPPSIGYSTSRFRLENGIVGTFTKVSDGNYTFSATNNASSIDVSGVELNLYNHMFGDLQDTIHIINAGKNNINSTLTAKQIFEANVEIVNFINKPRRFVMVGHFSNTAATTEHIAKVNELNRLLKAKYTKYFIDVKEILYSDATFTSLNITKTQSDIDAIARDTLPPSLSRDAGHLSAAMDILLCEKIEEKLLELGYL